MNRRLSVSGRERDYLEKIQQELKEYTDECYFDRFGNLVAHKAGKGKKLMFCCGADECGFVVSHIGKEGQIFVSKLGTFSEKDSARVISERGLEGILSSGDEIQVLIGAESAEEAEKERYRCLENYYRCLEMGQKPEVQETMEVLEALSWMVSAREDALLPVTAKELLRCVYALPGEQLQTDQVAAILEKLCRRLADGQLRGKRAQGESGQGERKETAGELEEIRATAEELLERFVRGDAARGGEGNGLGLALVKRVLVLMNGDIHVESRQGEGSTFTVRLPLPGDKEDRPEVTEL